MKKITFFLVAMLAFCWQGYSQDTCGTATAVTPGTITGTTITDGTGSSEMAPSGTDSAWFVYTATADGTIDVNACGGGADTDLSIGTGVCGALTILGQNDDSCDLGTGNNWASEVTGIAVTAGTDYYIEWSDEWSEGPFDWNLIFTPAPACTEATVDSASVNADCGAGTFVIDVVVSGVGDGTVITDGTNDYPIVAGTVTTMAYADGDSVTLDVQHSDSACDFSLGTFTSGCVPANDECAGAIAIACGGQYTGDTTAATPEDPDPGFCGTSAGTAGAVWYTFTGANSNDAGAAAGSPGDDVTLDLSLSTFDTKIRVFEGACGALTCVGGNDDGGTGTTSLITLATTVGTDYYVLVHGFSGNAGAYTLDVTCVPPPLCVPATFTLANGANNCPTEEFFVDVDVTSLGTGASVDISDDNGVLETAVGIGTYSVGPYAAGTAVNITVEDAAGDTCNATDSITTPSACPPANDECSGAIAVACGGQYTGDTTNASPEDPDPGFCGTSAGTAGAVWYAYTGANSNDPGAAAGTAGDEVTLDLSLSTFDTKIRLFSGTCGDLTCVDGDDDGGTGTTSLLTFTATVGTEYYILVHGFSGNAGAYTLDVTCVAPPLCVSTVVDSSTIVEDCVNGDYYIDHVVSTVGNGQFLTDGVTNWPISAGTVTTGPHPADGTAVTIDVLHDDIACDFSLGSFNFACPPDNDDAPGAESLSVGDTLCEGKVEGTNVGATDSAEAGASCGTPTSDVWYKVEVPVTGELTIETSASTGANPLSDTVMAVYSGMSGSLVEVACDDDGGSGLFSMVELTGLTPGEVLLVRVWAFSNVTKGTFDVCAWSPSTLGVEENNFTGFSYYPNPVKDVLTLNSPIGIDNVSVYNIVGQRIMDVNDTNIQSVDMSALQSGAYLVKISIEGQTKTLRLLKQ